MIIMIMMVRRMITWATLYISHFSAMACLTLLRPTGAVSFRTLKLLKLPFSLLSSSSMMLSSLLFHDDFSIFVNNTNSFTLSILSHIDFICRICIWINWKGHIYRGAKARVAGGHYRRKRKSTNLLLFFDFKLIVFTNIISNCVCYVVVLGWVCLSEKSKKLCMTIKTSHWSFILPEPEQTKWKPGLQRESNTAQGLLASSGPLAAGESKAFIYTPSSDHYSITIQR